MRVPIHWVVYSRKSSTVLLLAAIPIAMLIPRCETALSQSSTGTVAQTPIFTAIDLNPSGFGRSFAFGISGGQMVGFGYGPTTDDKSHALLWRGSGAGLVDLNPRGLYSQGYNICGEQQVGYGSGPATGGRNHALLWRGSAVSVVDLHPSGFEASKASGVSPRQQVGSGIPQGGPPGNDNMPTPTHALLWRGSSASVVGLHPHGFLSSTAQGTDGEEQVGYGSPEGVFFPMSSTPVDHALLWHGGAASVVDLNPTGFLFSRASGVVGGEEVGYGVGQATGGVEDHALLWHGSPASGVDLHPRGFSRSEAHSTNGEEQVGDGMPEGDYFHSTHALLWRGSAASVVDLHAFLPPGFVSSSATSIGLNGDIVGWAHRSIGSIGDPTSSHAFLWRRHVQGPGTSRERKSMGC